MTERDLESLSRLEAAEDLPMEAGETPESQVTRILMSELVKLRKRKKIAQEPLAKAIGISQSRLSQIENLKGGSMTLDVFILYAQSLGTEVILQPTKKKKDV